MSVNYITMSSEQDLEENWWILKPAKEKTGDQSEAPQPAELTDELLISPLIQLHIALENAMNVRNQISQDLFKKDYEETCAMFDNQRVDWLKPDISENSEPTSLQAMYTQFQKIAICLDVTLRTSTSRRDLWTRQKNYFKSVLWELHFILHETSTDFPNEVTSDCVPDDFFANDDLTYTYVREWLVFKEYMDGLKNGIGVVKKHMKKIISL